MVLALHPSYLHVQVWYSYYSLKTGTYRCLSWQRHPKQFLLLLTLLSSCLNDIESENSGLRNIYRWRKFYNRNRSHPIPDSHKKKLSDHKEWIAGVPLRVVPQVLRELEPPASIIFKNSWWVPKRSSRVRAISTISPSDYMKHGSTKHGWLVSRKCDSTKRWFNSHCGKGGKGTDLWQLVNSPLPTGSLRTGVSVTYREGSPGLQGFSQHWWQVIVL